MKRKLIVIAGVILAALAAGMGAVPMTAQAAPNPPGYQGGGVWVHPAAPLAEWGDDVPMPITVNVTDPSVVSYVNFTASWPGSNGWHILCTDPVNFSPSTTTVTCDFNPQAPSAPALPSGLPPVPALTNMTLSFDVYGQPGYYNKSPNGEHQVSWGWACIYNPPTSTCGGW